LCRKANGVKATLFSFILAQHEQILRWLATLPMVDANRVGFYGLSYGGETAVRVPPILEGYALSICSGDFNTWNEKVAATDQRFSFMYSIEWEMPYFNMDWSPFLRQTVRTHFSSNGELSHGIVTQAVHAGV
jgi:dienelactone hydrolase